MNRQYIINADDTSRQRLDIQHRVYRQNSMALLTRANSIKRMKGLEVGCGSGAMTEELLHLIGNDGQLVAVDLIDAQVDACKKRFLNVPNARFKQFDVTKLAQIGETFDFIYVRMVLHHLDKNNDVLEQMKNALNPGGQLIIEEPELTSGMFHYPPSPALDTFFALVGNCFKSSNKDYEVCFSMIAKLHHLDFDIDYHGVAQSMFKTPEEKRMFLMALTDFKPTLIERDLCTDIEIDSLYDNMHACIEDDTIISGKRMHQVIATV
jgi:ubiquinone/menaquinone biosynthesis C-methylase UbiE